MCSIAPPMGEALSVAGYVACSTRIISVAMAKFPGESPEYRRARNSLLRAEVKLRNQIEAVAAQRRKLPAGGEVKTDYVFDASAPGEKDFKQVRLSELFAPGKRT